MVGAGGHVSYGFDTDSTLRGAARRRSPLKTRELCRDVPAVFALGDQSDLLPVAQVRTASPALGPARPGSWSTDPTA